MVKEVRGIGRVWGEGEGRMVRKGMGLWFERVTWLEKVYVLF